MPDGYDPVVSVRIDRELLKRIDSICDRAGVSRAEVIDRCLYMGLANEERFVKALATPLIGDAIRLLTPPGVIDRIFKVFGGHMDETQKKIRRNVRPKRKSKRLGATSTKTVTP
jgi:hypothetical protein